MALDVAYVAQPAFVHVVLHTKIRIRHGPVIMDLVPTPQLIELLICCLFFKIKYETCSKI